jgi:hypothetical protein
METNLRSGHIRSTFYRGTGSVLAITLWLGAVPVLAGQARQQQPGPTIEQTPDQSAPATASQDVPPSLPARLTLKAGTVITVRVSQFLSSDRNVPGDSFGAELQQPLVVGGWVVARRGQTVLGHVAVAQKAGRVKGVSQLGVELTYLTLVDGQQLPIQTQLLQTSAGTSRGRDAAAIGSTTGVGAAIGAAAARGEGAAIGAGAGAAAGIAGVLLTRGRPTVIPPETVLTFQLETPVAFSTEHSRVAFRPVNQQDYDNRESLRGRPQHLAVAPYPPPPYYPYYWGYYPGFYPGPAFFDFGFYRFGGFGRFHR